MRLKLSTLAFAGLALSGLSAQADQVLYQYNGWLIKDGKSGPVAEFQDALNPVLEACGSERRLTADGVFGNGTKTAIAEAAACATISDGLTADSPARQGAITQTLWALVLPDTAAPSVSQRAAALKLTFENTDYDRMQWNFCQNRPFYAPQAGQPVCFSNDRASFITWGPSGATAGHGREVQAILNLYLERDDADQALTEAFGDETDNVKRMLTLRHESNGPLETYLCSVWMDRTQRDAWRAGFKALGKNKHVQTAYRTIYSSSSFDGGKINKFYKVWTSEAFDLPVTELDHAWFVDRATHMSISESKLRAAMTTLKDESGDAWPPSAAEIRQYISLNVRPSNQRVDRLGRDIAYYISSIEFESLSADEKSAWTQRGKRNAIDVGMSDDRQMPAFAPAASQPHPMPTGTLTAAEEGICPAAVLNPQRPG